MTRIPDVSTRKATAIDLTLISPDFAVNWGGKVDHKTWRRFEISLQIVWLLFVSFYCNYMELLKSY